MLFSHFFTFLLVALIALNLMALYKFQNSNIFKQYMPPLLLMIVWQYLYLLLTDLIFPEASELHIFTNDKIQQFAWSIPFLSTAAFVVAITKSENKVSRVESGFFGNFLIPIYLFANLIMLYITVMEKAIFQTIPEDLSTFIFVGMYYLVATIGFVVGSKYFAKRKVHASIHTSARTVLAFLASSIGVIYWGFKFILVTASFLQGFFFTPSIFLKLEQFTKWGFITFMILLILLSLPDQFFKRITQLPSIKKIWGRNVLVALTDLLDKTGHSSPLVYGHDLDLAIIESVSKIMDMRGLIIAGQSNERDKILLDVKDSTDIREVLESCITLSRQLKDVRMA